MGSKRTFFKTFFILLLIGIIGIPIALVIFGLESKPLVVPGTRLTFQDVERVKQLLKENGPRGLRADEVKSVWFTERDLNLLLDYALSHSSQKEKLSARIDLYQTSADACFTLTLPDSPFGAYLNVSAVLSQSSRSITLDKLKIGALTVPGWLLNPIGKWAHRYLQRYEDYRQVIEGVQAALENIQLHEDSLLVVYQWQPEVMKQLGSRGRDLLLPIEEKERLRAYYERLTMISQTIEGQNVSLTRFLQPLFQLARKRTLSSGDPMSENRALILTLALYSTGRNFDRIVGTKEVKGHWQPRRVNLTLLERHDLAQHFLVSAAIMVSAGSGLADLLGLFKEMDDAQGGSGFSFADLAADRAGVRLAEVATGSFWQARLLQQRMNQVVSETDFMPRVNPLPEGIQELEFKRKYQDLDSETYRMVEAEIEHRIAGCWVYQ